MEFREFAGRTLEEAIDKACAYFNTKQQYIDYEITKRNKNNRFTSIEADDITIRAKPKNNHIESDDVETTITPSATAELLNPYKEITPDAQKMVEILDQLLKMSGYEYRYKIEENDEELRINVFGPDMKGLIQEEGVGIESIKHLVGRMYSKVGEFRKRLNIDINDFRKEKEVYIKKLAHRLSDKVKKTHQEVLVNPMNAYDRRIFHLEVESIGGVTTKSIGDGQFKKIRLMPH